MSKIFSGFFLFVTLVVATSLNAQESATYESALLTVVHDTVVASESPGIVKKVRLEAGSDVEQGQILVALNRKEFEAEMEVTKLRMAIAELEASNDVDVRFAQKSMEVNQKLLQRSQNAREKYAKSIAQTDVDRVRLEFEQSVLSEEQAMLQAKVASRQFQLEKENFQLAEIRLENRNVCSPLKGRVEQIFVQNGEWVNAGQPIARIVDPTKLRVKAIFDTDYFKRIELGASADFSYINDEIEYRATGQVTYKSSVVKDGKFQAWVDVENSDLRLIPGIKGTLQVKLLER